MAITAEYQAREARAAKYGISVREDGHLSKPGAFAAIPEEQFADPVNYAYPMDTPERARAALAYWGQRKDQACYSPEDRTQIEARMKRLAEAQGVTVASFSVLVEVVRTPVEFTVDGSEGASPSLIPYVGKVFEIGDYPDKQFTLNEAEADAAIAAFTPVANDYEHQQGWLDGKLGSLQRVWREGPVLMGELLIPPQVRALAGSTLKTSLSWARETKQIIGNALTNTPRVCDATLTAAFSGRAESFTRTHGPTRTYTDVSTRMGTDEKVILHKEESMTLKERFLALFTGGKRPEELSEEELVQFTVNQELLARDGHASGVVREDPTISGIKQRQLSAEAEALFNAALAQGKLLPAQHDSFVATFSGLHKGDHSGVVTFTVDGSLSEGAGLQAFKAFVAALPENPALFAERLQTEAAQGNVLTFASGDSGKPSDARMATLKRYAGLSK